MKAFIIFLQRLMNTVNQEIKLDPFTMLPNFDTYEYKIGIPPDNTQIQAWEKIKECERRLVLFEWLENHINQATAKHRIYLDDCLSALILSLEATIQMLKNQINRSVSINFEKWFRGQPEYELHLRGLRTLRHLEAHVEHVPIHSLIKVNIGVSVSREWKLKKIGSEDLKKLRSPELRVNEIIEWNNTVSNISARELLTFGLKELSSILTSAEDIFNEKSK